MERTSISGLTIFYDADEYEAVDIVALACEQSVRTITRYWRLDIPQDCRVYILTTWPRCVFQGAPFGSQILLGLTFPIWYKEFKKRWLYSGGWSQQYGVRQVVGIKAPRLLAHSPDPMGESIFITQEEIDQKILSIVSHELTHAFSSHLRLPSWMHEGLAMVSVDLCLGGPTVRHNTLHLLRNDAHPQGSVEKIDLTKQSREEIILLYARGYWLTRYLVETQPELIYELLKEQTDQQELERSIAEVLGINKEVFWQEVDQLVIARYEQEAT